MKIVLASASPRRREILSMVCDSFDVRISSASESYSDDTPLDQIPKILAERKALSVPMEQDEIIIGADTVVICEGELMGKPKNEVYREFVRKFEMINKKTGKQQFIVPYLMSSHPGSTLKEAVELAEYLRDLGYMPEQVQDFYPTPSTISTCMYYTGVDPRTMKPVYVPKNPHEKAMQRALIQYRDPKNYDLVMEALRMAGRMDLVGFGEKCLIRPRKLQNEKQTDFKKRPQGKKVQDSAQKKKPEKKKSIRNIHKRKG